MGLLRSVFETSFDFLFQNKKLKKKHYEKEEKGCIWAWAMHVGHFHLKSFIWNWVGEGQKSERRKYKKCRCVWKIWACVILICLVVVVEYRFQVFVDK